MQVGGWTIYAHPLFLGQLERLVTAADRAKQRNPEGYAHGRDAKMLAAVLKLAFDDIPGDPTHPRFEQGQTLGPERKHWRRAKFYQQYRLFFRFSSSAKLIVLAWINDEDTKRAYGSRRDAYAVFAKMLQNSNPPDDWDALLKASTIPAMRTRRQGARTKA